jgi:hypothetical protein
LTKQAGILSKQSFEARAKRLGVLSDRAVASSYIEQYKDKPFWLFDRARHKLEYDRTNGRCCFNHLIGLPKKNDVSYPLFHWQKEIWDALQSHKLIAILKARGVGASELAIRYAMWLCLKDNQMQGKNIAIVTGIRENLSLELLNRFRNLLPDYDWQTGASSNIATINKCRVIGYPSKRTKDLRGIDATKLCICDEFSHFDSLDQEQILPILEAFRTKSDCQILLMSTPGAVNDVYFKLFAESESTCRYKRLYIPWTKVYRTLLSEQELAEARQNPNFSQEYELKFGSYGENSCFSPDVIDRAIKLGQQYTAKYKDRGYPHALYLDGETVIGVDVGAAASQFAICVMQLWDRKMHIARSEVYQRPKEWDMIHRILTLYDETDQTANIYVDGANVSFIRTLASQMPSRKNERVDKEEFISYIKKHGWIQSDEDLAKYMVVVPVSFAKHGNRMLEKCSIALSRGWLAIDPRFEQLISDLRNARTKSNATTPWALDKSVHGHDALDSLRLACHGLKL